MSTPEAKLLRMLRSKRRMVAALLAPALLAWVASGSACITMAHGGSAPAHRAEHSHAGHHAAHHDVNPHAAPTDVPCPHCPSAATAAAAAHPCASVDGTGAKLTSAPLPDTTPLLIAPSWVLLPSTPAPPLIRLTALPRDALTAHISLNILHCVLLI